MKLIIEDDEGRQTVVPFVRDEITIGRLEGNTIRLTERNVSRRHARLVRQNGHVLVEDLGSSYGIHINGKRIREPVPVADGDLIQIGDYDLAIQGEGQEATAIRKRPEPEPSDDDQEEGLLGADEPTATANAPAPRATAPQPPPADDLSRHPTALIPVAGSAPAPNHPERLPYQLLDPENAPRLVVLNTGLAGREFACIRTDLKIGRAEQNDIAVDHPSVGARHARLWLDDETWKITDLGSSNGVSHNDAPVQEAALRSGDLLEVGTVKFKFVGPGVAFRFDPKATYLPPKTGHTPKIVVGVLVLVVVGFVGWRFASHLSPFGGGQVAPSHVAQPVQSSTPTAIGADALTAAATLQKAQEAIAAREFDQAITLLEAIQNPSAEDSARIAPLLAQAQEERSAQQAIASAKDAIARADFKGARAALAGGARGRTFESERAVLIKQISDAQTDALYEQGREELKTGKFHEAAGTFGRCLTVDGTAARCHMLLGASFAQLAAGEPDARSRAGELDKAVSHYRKFLQYAGPDDSKEAEKVKAILKSYEGKRK
jgi:pSer/pThr/pTyr-binding forkhead associated (FHA) protein